MILILCFLEWSFDSKVLSRIISDRVLNFLSKIRVNFINFIIESLNRIFKLIEFGLFIMNFFDMFFLIFSNLRLSINFNDLDLILNKVFDIGLNIDDFFI